MDNEPKKISSEDAVRHNTNSAKLNAQELRLAENHACALTAAFRTGMKNGTSFRLMLVKMIAKEEFELLPEKTIFGMKTRRFSDPEKWFLYSYNKRRICNVKLVMEREKQFPSADLGEGKRICCLYENGSASCFCPVWSYDEPTDKWSVVYYEQPWEDTALIKSRFEDNTEQLRAAFIAMTDFTDSLGCTAVTSHLLCCLDELDGRNAKWEQANIPAITRSGIAIMRTPKLPEKLAHIYTAASRAPSWNTGMRLELLKAAETAGRESEYETLMEELSERVNYAMMYAVNEC